MPSSARGSAAPLRAKIASRAALCALVAGLALTTGGTAAAQAPPACPNAAPPPPVDTSEVPAPGAPVPAPVPVPETPVGGDRMAECGVITAPGLPQPPGEVSAPSWVLADLDSGAVLAARDPHARHRPASTIKVLTALTALRALRLDDTIVATQDDANQEGSRVGLSPGVTYSVQQVLTGLIMQSGNDAAHALAMKMGGMQATVDKMNAVAASLGALDTRTATPSGLDGPGMSTSAYDLAAIFRAAMHEPAFAAIIGTHNTLLPGAPGGPPLEVWSDNQVLLGYPGGLGGKTGFTDDARHTFIGAAERGGHRLVAVLMRGENQPIRLSAQAMQLLDYGFGLSAVEPVGELVTTSPGPSTVDSSPEPQANSPEDGQPRSSSMFGTIGGPLAVLVLAAAAAIVALARRQRRAKLAAASRQQDEDDHP
ncbi:D-alanyl-D-alanine carboxypeptidase [Saccharopolyspora sp. K220]|uniref:D-alanyl-D-alanine carboxypeptidase family protein n=1 Tax=Saccharopolyspora soli TaxID=2926618 RepID=UPI001F590830|nr:D-alanyl-D-alanine carboxypeptidase family protein [Saccharopolyspora soli]MCI2419005.1 D-alanyl-D-alanine carboxypeptidase [Saccharopolyspora soli]